MFVTPKFQIHEKFSAKIHVSIVHVLVRSTGSAYSSRQFGSLPHPQHQNTPRQSVFTMSIVEQGTLAVLRQIKRDRRPIQITHNKPFPTSDG